MIKTTLLFFCACLCMLTAYSQFLPAVTVAGGNGRGSAPNQLADPDGIWVDAAGNIYIADYSNSRVQKWGPYDLAGTTVAGGGGGGNSASKLQGPADVTLDALGNLYVSDYLNARVQKWAPGASSGVTVAGGNGVGSAANQLNLPQGIYVDAAGNVYVADYYNSRIQKWAPGATSGVTVAGGNGQGSAANQFVFVKDVFVDGAGNVYGVDNFSNRVQKWAPGATSGVTVAGGNGRGSSPNQLDTPWNITGDAAGNIYVSDPGNGRIQKYAPGASSGVTIIQINQNVPASQKFYLTGMFLDSKGNIYGTDEINHRILKYAVPGAATACPANIMLTVASCTDEAIVKWSPPRDTFPGDINIPAQLDPYNGALTYIGNLEGHGYYRSTHTAMWPVAMDIARFIGGTDAFGHLVTFNSTAEQSFIYNKVKGSGYSPWVGLYNTGTPGAFRWVTDEPLTYTNWSPGEPNNSGGTAKKVREPYVRLMDGSGSWNDQRSDNVPYIVEFDKPLIRYKQISGPTNGSSLPVGTYTVCYEGTNLITDATDTCCFTITVACKSGAAANSTPAPFAAELSSDGIQGLRVATSPNPSSSFFRLNLSNAGSQEKLTVQVTDIAGKVLEVRKGVAANQTLQIGSNLKPGVYYAQVTQGAKTVVVKLVKQSH